MPLPRSYLSLSYIASTPVLTPSELVVNCSPPAPTFPWPKKLLVRHSMVRRPTHVQSLLQPASPPKLKWKKVMTYINVTPAVRRTKLSHDHINLFRMLWQSKTKYALKMGHFYSFSGHKGWIFDAMFPASTLTKIERMHTRKFLVYICDKSSNPMLNVNQPQLPYTSMQTCLSVWVMIFHAWMMPSKLWVINSSDKKLSMLCEGRANSGLDGMWQPSVEAQFCFLSLNRDVL